MEDADLCKNYVKSSREPIIGSCCRKMSFWSWLRLY